VTGLENLMSRYNMAVYPEVRVYADPLEGLTAQLTELRGLITIVPPLIDQDRKRRWAEINQRPSDGEDGDVIDVYGAKAGPEEGHGFADFGRTIRVAAVVFAWAVFQDYLARELKRTYLSYDLSETPALAVLVNDDVRNWDRRFDQIKKRYRDFAGIALSDLPSWDQVLTRRSYATPSYTIRANTRGHTWGRSLPIDRPRRIFSALGRPRTTPRSSITS
jgi:hypothetical protein